MTWLGDYPEDHTTVVVMFTTHAAAGSPVAPSSAFEIADVRVYKNGSATEKTTTNGMTMTSPFDSITGLHCVVIDTSNDTGDGGFWVTGAVYTVVLSPDETVDSVAVAKVIGQFGIELYGALRPTTAGRKLDVSAGGEAGLDWANIGSPTTAQNLSATNIDVDQVVASVSGAVGSVTGLTNATIADAVWDEATSGHTTSGTFGEQAKTDIDAILAFGAPPSAAVVADAVWDEDATAHQTTGTFGQAIGDPVADTNTIYGAVVTGAAGATVAADIIAIQADTDNIQTRLPTSLVSGRMDSSVGAMAADVITAAATATDFATEINTGMATSAAVAALPTAAAIADQVWDEVLSGHLTAGTTGNALNAAGAAGDPWSTALPGAYGSGTAGKIIGDNVNATISSRATQTSVDDIPTNAELATSQAAADDATLAAIAALTIPSAATIADAVWDEDATAHQTQGTFGQAIGDPGADANTIYGAVVTGAAGATVAADIIAIQADTDNLQVSMSSVPTASAVADAVWDEAITGHLTSGTTGKYLADTGTAVGSLTFTVAGQVDANIQSVNDVTVTGTGTVGDTWGPA